MTFLNFHKQETLMTMKNSMDYDKIFHHGHSSNPIRNSSSNNKIHLITILLFVV